MACLRSALSRIRREESGVSIIEVLVSAVLVAMIAVGVLKGLDAANAASGNSKNRAIAADLASQDQERMRAIRASDLSSLNRTYQKTVAGVPFSIASTAEWVNDGSESRRCAQSPGRADYLRINSSVTWDNMLGASPVTQTSLYAPSSKGSASEGSLGIEVLDRNAAPVAGVSVSAAGPVNVSGTTDDAGCVFFPFLPEGDYTTTVSKAGYVGRQGESVITSVFGVEGGTTQVQPVDYDLAGSVDVSVRSRRGAGTADLVAYANYLTLGHSQLDSPNTRRFGDGTPSSSFPAPGLFPFTSSYSAYSGDCPGAAPASPPLVTVNPGGASAVTVREVAVRLSATGYNPLPSGTGVKMYARGTGCSGTILVSVGSGGWIQASNGDPGVPFGTYDICAYSGGYRAISYGRLVDNVDGVDLNLGSVVSGSCP